MTKDLSSLVDLALTSPVTCSTTEWQSSYVLESHYHNNDQLIYTAGGVISVETGEGIWVVPPTRAVWVPAKISHSVHISGPMQLVTLQFSSLVSPLAGKNCRVVNVSPLLREGILRSRNFPDSYQDDCAEAHIIQVILDEIHAAEKLQPLHLPIPIDTRAKTVAQGFLKDPSQRLSLKEWASRRHSIFIHTRVSTAATIPDSFQRWLSPSDFEGRNCCLNWPAPPGLQDSV